MSVMLATIELSQDQIHGDDQHVVARAKAATWEEGYSVQCALWSASPNGKFEREIKKDRGPHVDLGVNRKVSRSLQLSLYCPPRQAGKKVKGKGTVWPKETSQPQTHHQQVGPKGFRTLATIMELPKPVKGQQLAKSGQDSC